MSIPRIAPATSPRLVRGTGQLHAAGLAAAADEHLGLDDDLAGAFVEEPLGGRDGLVDGVGDGPRRDRQALGDEQRLRVGFLDLHGRGQAPGMGRWAGRDGTASDRVDGTISDRSPRQYC